jgi:hypothetical protein
MKHFVDEVQYLDSISGEFMEYFAYLNIRQETFPNP